MEVQEALYIIPLIKCPHLADYLTQQAIELQIGTLRLWLLVADGIKHTCILRMTFPATFDSEVQERFKIPGNIQVFNSVK